MFSTSELLRGVCAMPSSGYSNGFAAGTLASLALLTASNSAWNLSPSFVRSRFHPCQ
jgi:hypothetical protein